MKQIISKTKNNRFILNLVTALYRLFAFNKIKGKVALKLLGGVRIKHTCVRDKGANNEIVIGDYSRVYNCSFYFKGVVSKIIIGNHVLLQNVEFHVEDNGNEITIGDGCNLTGKAHIACTEGKRIVIGEKCLFSNEIVIRTGDSHSIVNNDGLRINPAEDVTIGDRVWVGQHCTILKGCKIGDDSILATGCVVTKGVFTPNSILAGIPAKTVKKDVSWKMERI